MGAVGLVEFGFHGADLLGGEGGDLGRGLFLYVHSVTFPFSFRSCISRIEPGLLKYGIPMLNGFAIIYTLFLF